jgi:hypothetical protein
MKYFGAVLRQQWVLTTDWVLDSLKQKKLQPESGYVVSGDPFAAGAARKCRNMNTRALFEKVHFYLDDTAAKDLTPLIRLAGATVHSSLGSVLSSTSLESNDAFSKGNVQHGGGVMVHNEDGPDGKELDPGVARTCKQNRIPVVRSQWILACVSHLEIQPTDSFRLPI